MGTRLCLFRIDARPRRASRSGSEHRRRSRRPRRLAEVTRIFATPSGGRDAQGRHRVRRQVVAPRTDLTQDQASDVYAKRSRASKRRSRKPRPQRARPPTLRARHPRTRHYGCSFPCWAARSSRAGWRRSAAGSATFRPTSGDNDAFNIAMGARGAASDRHSHRAADLTGRLRASKLRSAFWSRRGV